MSRFGLKELDHIAGVGEMVCWLTEAMGSFRSRQRNDKKALIKKPFRGYPRNGGVELYAKIVQLGHPEDSHKMVNKFYK